jgi:hypothetical protein
MSEPTLTDRAKAREILARLIPHRTSVQNVDIVAEALHEAQAVGFAAAGAEFRAHAEKIRNATEDVSDEAIIAAARAEERERCAKIAESAFDRDPIDPSDAEADATWIATKIRSGE